MLLLTLCVLLLTLLSATAHSSVSYCTLFCHDTSRLLALQYALRAISNALDLIVSLLDYFFHALLRLLDVIRAHFFVELVLPDQLVVVLSCALNHGISLVRCLLGRLDSVASCVAGGWWKRDLDGEGVVGFGRKRCKGVRGGSNGGGYGLDVLQRVSMLLMSVAMFTYCLIPTNDVQNPPSRDHLGDIAQSHSLLALSCGAELHLQALDNVRVQPSSTSQLGKVVCELLNGPQDRGLKFRDIVGLVSWCGLAGLANGWARIGARMGFVGFASLLVERRTQRETPRGLYGTRGWRSTKGIARWCEL